MNETLAAVVEEFAAARAQRLIDKDRELGPVVQDALDARLAGRRDWAQELATAAGVLWLEIYEETGGQVSPGNVDGFVGNLTAHLENTARVPASQRDSRAQRITDWISVFTINAATVAAAETLDDIGLQWVTMRDQDVRSTHRPLEGQQIMPGGTFDVNGTALHFPGEPVGPPEVWIQCRCMAMPIPGGEMSTLTAATTPADAVEAVEDPSLPPEWDDEMEIEVPWHGILAVEGIPTGDLRMFASQALSYDKFPLSLTWQKYQADAHDGSVVVGRITNAWTGPDGLIYGEGMFRTSPEGDEVIDMIANGDLRGVSVELDSAAVEFSDVDGNPLDMDMATETDVYRHLTAGRVRSATILPVAAFAESYVALGPWPEEEAVTASCAPCIAKELDDYAAAFALFAISEAAWDGSASRFTDEEWERATVVDRGEEFATAKERYALPIREPNGDLSRAGVHAAAGRVDQVDAPAEAITSAKRQLVAAYRELDQEPPESIVAAAFAPMDRQEPESRIAVGDRVTWTEFVMADEVTREGTVVAIDDGEAEVETDGGSEYEVDVDDLTKVGSEAEEEDQDLLAASPPGTRDGPGWITNPEDTQRLRTYWTRGEGAAKIRWGQPGDFNRCRRQLAKYVPNPSYLAGTCANMHYVALGVWPGQEHAAESMVASASVTEREQPKVEEAVLPKAEWFQDPGLPLPTPLTIVKDAESGLYRVMGHAAQWGVCHTGLGLSVGQGGCTVAPHSETAYAYYRTGAVETEAGLVPVGQITMATGHAASNDAYSPAAAHYDNTGTVVADVAAGEDEHGIWVAGVMRPRVTGEQRAELLAATLSGDWRWIGGNLEMVATLAVNTPGFPIPRVAVSASGGRQTTLQAAGIVPPRVEVAQDDGVAVVASAAEIARELHRLQKAEIRKNNAQRQIATARQEFNSERAARALSVITNGK